ncbi:MAG: hypothetical protein PHT43_01705 [Anaerolineaceae bacterium]|nr:hypothetical protein [Anaerolineaceae bacterium]
MNFEFKNQTRQEKVWSLLEQIKSNVFLVKVIEEADKELESPENVNALENLAIAVGSFALTILAELKTIGEEKELNSSENPNS